MILLLIHLPAPLLGGIPQPIDTPNSYINQPVIDDIINSFNNASDYSVFYVGTNAGTEGGWFGFRHATRGEGIFLCRYGYNPYFFIIESGAVTFYKV